MNHRTKISFIIIILVLLLTIVLSLALGSVAIPIREILLILGGNESSKETWTRIVMDFRLPKSITAVFAGAALSLSGLQMQTLFRNPLAGPFVLGVSSGASLGVALVVLGTGSFLLSTLSIFGHLSLAVAAILGSSLVMGLVLLVSARIENNMTLLILGIMFGYLASSLVSILIYFSDVERIQSFVIWTFGSFSSVSWLQIRTLIFTLSVGIIIVFLSGKSLNALLLGENYAKTMGLNVKYARIWIIISTSVLSGTVTAFCGPIAFLGIAVPHLCRGVFNTSDHKILIPSVAIMGAIIALVSDMIAQVPGSDKALPLNSVTAFVGAPVIIWVILRRRSLKSSFAS